jgi:hypothetical protein
MMPAVIHAGKQLTGKGRMCLIFYKFPKFAFVKRRVKAKKKKIGAANLKHTVSATEVHCLHTI